MTPTYSNLENYSAIFCDIHDTILPDSSSVLSWEKIMVDHTESVNKLRKLISEKKIKFGLVSGGGIGELQVVPQFLNLQIDYLIAGQGAYISKDNGGTWTDLCKTESYYIGQCKTAQVIKKLDASLKNSKIIASNHLEQHLRLIHLYSDQKVEDIYQLLTKICLQEDCRGYILTVYLNKLEVNMYSNKFGKDLDYNHYVIMIAPSEVNKANAINKYILKHNIAKEKVLAYINGTNDIDICYEFDFLLSKNTEIYPNFLLENIKKLPTYKGTCEEEYLTGLVNFLHK